MTKQIVIAHKGASGYAPENTIRSFRRAYELGAHMVELDVRETLDGQLVCIHDKSVDRTTNGSGEVHKLSYEELSKLDAGDGEIVPLLEDVLKYVSGKIQVNIELKTAGVENEVLKIIERTGMENNILISSFLHGTLATIRDLNKDTATAILFENPIEDISQYALDFAANAINPHHNLISHELVAEAHAETLKVYPWTVNDLQRMKQLYAFGADGLITDYPDLALEILQRSS